MTSSTSPQPGVRRRQELPIAAEALVLHEVLGQGGAAIVYRAFDSRLDRSVAVKLLPPAAALDALGRERFCREIRIAAALDHPHIVPIFATGETDTAPYLEMQAIRGRSLSQVVADLQALARSGTPLTGELLLQLADPDYQAPEAELAAADGPFSPLRVRAAPCYYMQIARWLAAIASALDHVHTRGYLHGDVKPGNLLVEPSGQIWLIDFGTACDLAAAEAGDSIVGAGTLPYLAPERLDGDAPPDVRQDVYGLGATLYELLTLRRAVAGETAPAVMRELATSRPPSPRQLAPDTPPLLAEIATKCLARRPANRYATMAELEQALHDSVGCMSGAKYTGGAMVHCASLMHPTVIAALLLGAAIAAYFIFRPTVTPLGERAANLASRLPPGLVAEAASGSQPRVRIAGTILLAGQPVEIPLDLAPGDKVAWQVVPRPVLEYAGHSYTLTPKASGWEAAERLAQSWGGHLVTINDLQEQEFLNQRLLAKGADGKYPVRWIDLSAADPKADYRWSSGESVTYQNWNRGEPTRALRVERCVAANWHLANGLEGHGQVGDWNNLDEDGGTKGALVGIVELPDVLATSPPSLSLRSRSGRRLAELPASGKRLPVTGRIVIEAGPQPHLVDVTIEVQ